MERSFKAKSDRYDTYVNNYYRLNSHAVQASQSGFATCTTTAAICGTVVLALSQRLA